MSPLITISEETLAKLKALGETFVDTPDSVVSSLADAELNRRAISPNGNGRGTTSGNEPLRLDPDSHESLAHTRLISATVDGQPIHRPNWNGVLDYLHIQALKTMGSFEALRRASGANLREGRYEESGFKYLPEVDLSVQGVGANLAWDHSLRLARALGVPIQLKFEWRKRNDAAHPGKTGELEWTPTKQ